MSVMFRHHRILIAAMDSENDNCYLAVPSTALATNSVVSRIVEGVKKVNVSF